MLKLFFAIHIKTVKIIFIFYLSSVDFIFNSIFY